MKVVILCGGKGTRLREETEYRPKPMVPIGGRPILWHIMKIYATHGFNEFVLCLGYKQDHIREYFLNYKVMNSDVTLSLDDSDSLVCHSDHPEPWTVTLADTGQETPKGTRIKMVAPYLGGERFMVTYGDGVANIDVARLVEHHEREGRLATFTGVHPISRFATVERDEDGEIHRWEEKKALEDYINAGFFVFEPRVLDYIQGEVELEREPLERLARERQVTMYRHEGFWHCMDTYRDYMDLNDLWDSDDPPWKIWDE